MNVDDKSGNTLKSNKDINNKKIYSYEDNNKKFESKSFKNSNNCINYYNYDSNQGTSINNNSNDLKKNDNSSNYDSSRYDQSYNRNIIVKKTILYSDNKETNNNNNIIDNENTIKRSLAFKNIGYKERERIKKKNYKNDAKNKMKYNDLIKYKLAMSYSINKRKWNV